MRVFFTDRHVSHAPNAFMVRGQIAQCPEVPRRADILLDAALGAGHAIQDIGSFGLEPVMRIHDQGLVEFLESAWTEWDKLPDRAQEIVPNVHPGRNMDGQPTSIVGLAGRYQADAACPIGMGTWEAVRASADTALSATAAVLNDLDSGHKNPFAYALCRPPGHHAFGDQAGGFCYLNNTAISTQMCVDRGVRKVAIVDVDVHHGNGTQGIFYRRQDVLTVSLHGDPAQFYPFYAGYSHETGADAGAGYNRNHPLAFGTSDDAYVAELQLALEEIAAFGPDLLIVALGLDASEHDGLSAFLKITTKGFERIGEALGRMQLPTVLIQEGGYVSDYLGANLAATLRGFESHRS
ncbi:MAG: histone deacetylase family protein [Gammaproteobacteria bacterium]|nr:histone deacetylase family protein [Gammaproteobacteria bacterium]